MSLQGAYERQPRSVLRAVVGDPSTTGRRRQQAQARVVARRAHRDACTAGKLVDGLHVVDGIGKGGHSRDNITVTVIAQFLLESG